MIEKEIEKRLIGVEILGWYDGIAYYYDPGTGKRYSRNYNSIDTDELCRYGYIYKVQKDGEYSYKVLSRRPDEPILNPNYL